MNATKKLMALLCAAAMALPAVACSHGGSSGSEGESSGSGNDTSIADEFVVTDQDGSVIGGQLINNDNPDDTDDRVKDPEAAVTTVRGTDGKAYVVKTDINGATVTEANGEAVTELYTGTTLATTYAKPDYQAKYQSYQSFWLDTSQKKDYVFDGELLVFEFKVKEDAPDGVYPVQIFYADVANYDAKTLKDITMNVGYICVGMDQPAAAADGKGLTFTPATVSAKQGETVKVALNIKNNPGFCAFDLRMRYDSNAVSVVKTKAGKDFASRAALTAHDISDSEE